jgi:RND family efflux transporter MFP subunit
VGGEIIDLNPEFIPGGLLQEKTQMLQIDPKDYQLALQQKQRGLSDAEYAYKLELGRQDVARREWNLLYGENIGGQVESELALRKPHLEKAQADIEAAKAEIELAKINLARTTVTSPFNALVLNKYVDLGSQVSPQEKLADLVGTDEYWVQVSVPVEHLKWLKIPNDKNDEGAQTTILYRESSRRQGKIIRLLADLSKEGRMARLLVEIEDPLDLQVKDSRRPPLLIGEYVRVLIDGADLHDVYRIPRFALRNDNQVWFVDKDKKLVIKPVNTLWREEEYVYVRDGLQPDDLLIISPLAAPIDGMDLRIEGAEAEKSESMAKQLEGSGQKKQ